MKPNRNQETSNKGLGTSAPTRWAKRFLLLAALALILLVVAVPFLAKAPSDGDLSSAESDVSLGAARQHVPSMLDLIARAAKEALDASAGSADSVPQQESIRLDPTASELELLQLANLERAREGLRRMEIDPSLLGVARARANAQLPDGRLSHVDTLGSLAFVGLLAESGVSYSLAGENLARSSTSEDGVVARLHQLLMNSPTHRANILEPSFNLLAVGSASESSGRIAFAQIFRAAGD